MKQLIWLVVIFAAVALGAYFLNAQRGTEDGSKSESVAVYFQDRMWAQGVENLDGAMPIEGFDAELLMGAFSGLLASDFEGVRSFEGIYDEEGGEVVYSRTEEQPITSAEKTVSLEGYETLLNNIANRLGLPAETEADVDAVIEEIN